MADKVAAAVAAMALAVTLFAAGFGACTLPPPPSCSRRPPRTTRYRPTPTGGLTALAVETRGFTVDDYGRDADSEDGARDRLHRRHPGRRARGERGGLACQRALVGRSPQGGRRNRGRLLPPGRARSAGRRGRRLRAGWRRALPPGRLQRPRAGCRPRALGRGGARRGRARVSARAPQAALGGRGEFVVAPAVLIVAFAALGAWAALDFNGLFSAFHAVLFPQGNWTFSYDSLLISMYPLDFWMGMAGISFSTTLALSILAIVVGVLLRRPGRNARGHAVLKQSWARSKRPSGVGSCGNCARRLGHSAQAARTTPLP